MTYRPEIDGLRAIAVVAVLLYHAEIPGFEGGLLGVDVFFVISGYLITSILWKRLEAGTFGFAEFYRRRLLRLLPVLFLVLAVSTCVAMLVLFPPQLRNYGRDLVGVSTYLSNMLSWQVLDYFRWVAPLSPLIHAWSLSVEEQFYLFHPVLVVVLYRYQNRGSTAFLAIGTIASLALATVLIDVDLQLAFYSLPTRAWELLAGAVLARVQLSHRGTWSDAAGGLGVLLLGVAIATENFGSPTPGPGTIPAVAGTALMLHGTRASHGVGWVLAQRPLVHLGALSYGIYLWHQPVFAFSRELTLEHLGMGHKVFGILLSIGLAQMSYVLVEDRFRRFRTSFKTTFVVTTSISGAFALIGVGLYASRGLPQRFTPEMNQLFEIPKPDLPEECTWSKRYRPDAPCRFGADVEPTIMLYGDSHSHAFANPIADRAARAGKSILLHTYLGCPPLQNMQNRTVVNCTAFNAEALEHATRTSIETVIISARWSFYFNNHLMDGSQTEATSTEITKAFVDNLETLAKTKQLVIIHQTPTFVRNAPTYVARSAWWGQPKQPPLEPVDPRVDEMLGRVKGNVIHVYPLEGLCPGGVCRATSPRGSHLFRDSNHLSKEGANLALKSFDEQVEL